MQKLTSVLWRTVLAVVWWVGVGMAAGAEPAEWTAFKLVQKGNDYVGPDARDRVVQIRSEKSSRGLHPSVWSIVYYDPDASLKATEVRFVNGEKEAVRRPFRLLEPIGGKDREMPRAKLKKDSTEILRAVTKVPELQGVKLTASQMWLEWMEGQPIWKVRVWAEHRTDPGLEVELGEVVISPETGETQLLELNLKKLTK